MTVRLDKGVDLDSECCPAWNIFAVVSKPVNRVPYYNFWRALLYCFTAASWSDLLRRDSTDLKYKCTTHKLLWIRQIELKTLRACCKYCQHVCRTTVLRENITQFDEEATHVQILRITFSSRSLLVERKRHWRTISPTLPKKENFVSGQEGWAIWATTSLGILLTQRSFQLKTTSLASSRLWVASGRLFRRG